MINMDIKSLSELEDEFIGKKGTPRRDEYEKELADLMIGCQLKNARIKLDLTQEQLAERVNKKEASYRSSNLIATNLLLFSLPSLTFVPFKFPIV